MEIHDFYIPQYPLGEQEQAVKLMMRRWCSETIAPRYILGIVHGLGEHGQRYAHVADYFVADGATVLAIDQRGHGRTGGGLPHFDAYLDDIGTLESYLHRVYPGIPVLLYGQSLGGSVVINYAMRRKHKLAGIIACSPLLRTTFPPPAWKLSVARLLGRWWPGLTLSTAIVPKELSRDPRSVAAYVEDSMVHQRVSAALGLSMLEAGQWAIDHASELETPLLLMHGTDDRITSCQASGEFAEQAKEHCTWIEWQGLFHDMHWEPERQELFEAMRRFIESRIVSEANRAARTE